MRWPAPRPPTGSRRRFGGVVLVASLCLSACAAGDPQADPEEESGHQVAPVGPWNQSTSAEPGKQPSSDHSARAAPWGEWVGYGPEARQRYRLREGAPGGGLIVLIHGGGWIAGDASMWTTPGAGAGELADRLHQEGYWVAALEYRFTHEVPWPATAQDVHLGLRAAATQATTEGAGDGVAVMGESAGAHLAALEGVHHSEQVDAVVSLYGVFDLLSAQQQRKEQGCPVTENPVENAIFGLGPREADVSELSRRASPALQVDSQSPPMVLLHGSSDCVLPVGSSRQMAEALRGAEVPVELQVLPGAGHADAVFFTAPGVQELIVDFLASELS